MKRQLLFGLHLHQPVDNLPEAVQKAVEQCYLPLFTTLQKYPQFKTNIHISGWLLEQLRQNYPAVMDALQSLNSAGAVEFFTGGYYEPILAAIPKKSRKKQILKLSRRIQREFDQTPRGLWLAERVWESGVVADMVESGIHYIMVDDYHFLAAGFDRGELDGYYLTEEGGKSCALFPIAQELRYAIPFYPVEEAIAKIKSYKMAIIFDDAEKFGLWPKTYAWVYEKGWLEKFIERVLADEEIETIHYKEALMQRPLGLAYLPNVSYYEMGEWSLRSKDALELEQLKERLGEEYMQRVGMKFIRGGIWKNFFIKYEEANRLHKRMLALAQHGKKSKIYQESLLKLQTNDVYWHGIFGGLYLPNLRDNAYRYVAECERVRYKGDSVGVEDSDLDGYEEVTIHKESMLYRFYSRYGGQLIELLDKERRWNFQNTLTRRFEAYHEELLHPKEHKLPQHEEGISTIHTLSHTINPALKEALFFDWYTKNSFVDHISDESLHLKSFKACNFKEYGDFANQPFVLAKRAPLTFEREGGIYHENKFATTLTKTYHFDNGIAFRIALVSESFHTYRYALEFNFHFAHYDEVTFNGVHLADGVTLKEKKLEIIDPFTQRVLKIAFAREGELFIAPLETVSQSERGYEITLQGVSIAFCFDFSGGFVLEGVLKAEDV